MLLVAGLVMGCANAWYWVSQQDDAINDQATTRMTELPVLVLSLLAGGVVGGIFFGGLWWTVRLGLVSPWPAVWFLGSFVLRTAISLAGFYLVGHNDWLACWDSWPRVS